MGRITETVSTLNSFIRTVLAVVIVGGVGYGSYLGYSSYLADEQRLRKKLVELDKARDELSSLNVQLASQTQEIDGLTRTLQSKEQQVHDLAANLEQARKRVDRLETSMHLLKVDHRLAEISVLDQEKDQETGKAYSTIEFTEVNDQGVAIDQPRTFRIEGDLVYVDHWIVKFDDQYVEQQDVDRSTSICLFRRIFGEFQEPREGYTLDKVGSRPMAYARGGKMSEFERSIWSDFWNIANDPQRAREMGIRAAHGEAVVTRLRKGQKYRLALRASGGLSITPIEQAVSSGNGLPAT